MPEISGGKYDAPVVMAQNINGPVHFDSPRPEEQPAGRRRTPLRSAGPLVLLGLLLYVGISLKPVEEMLSPGARRLFALTGVGLMVVGSLWWVTTVAGLTARLRERFAPRRRLAPAQLDAAADSLATVLADEYARDEKQLHVNDPAPIPVRWSAAGPHLSDHRANILRTPITASDGTAQPLDMEGDFDGIAAFYARVPSGRLVILGAPGAGKSALVLRLARDLLGSREPGAPVPVLLPIASWNSAEEDPWHWAARRLAALHPTVLRTPQLAHDLLTSGRLLPVLDGLDELPEPARPKALTRLRRTLNEPARLVLTCRIEEYEAAVEDTDTVLPAAAVVQLEPLSVADLERYLPRTARPTGPEHTDTKWTPVLARLADAEDRAPEVESLRAVLSTPLMVSLARFVYTGTRADPTELLEDDRFRERATLERHLYDAFLSAAYEDTGRAGWTGEQARAWTGYLAAHLRRTGEQDIAWWRLGEVVPRSVRWVGTGLAMAIAALAVGVTGYDHPWWREWVPVPPWVVVLVLGCVAAVLDWCLDAPVDAPRRLHWPGRADLQALRSELRLLVLIVPLAVLLIGALVVLNQNDSALRGTVLGVVVIPSVVLSRLIDRFTRLADPADAPEPAELLRADRRTQLVLGPFTPARQPLRRLFCETALILVAVVLACWLRIADRSPVTWGDWVLALGLLLLALAVCRWSVSAAGRLAVARVYLACTGALPWRVMTFLRDAHRRGVLRQSGGLYRFRHIELRNRLAEGAGVTEDGTSNPDPAREEDARPPLVDLLFAGPLLILFAAGLASVLMLPDFKYPHEELPEPCALVGPAHRQQLFADPVKKEDRNSCALDERSPFRPDRRLTITTALWWSNWTDGSGTDMARRYFDEIEVRDNKPLSGLGDEAMVLMRPDGRHKEPKTVVTVRTGNVLLWVEYSEQYAEPVRVYEVAILLARDALRRASAPDADVGTDPRALADIPPAKLPDPLPIAAYRRVPEQSLRGAVWRDEEHSDIHTFMRLEVPVRLPPDFTCSEGDKPSEDGDTTARCSVNGNDPPLLDMADLPCGRESCPSSVTGAFRTRWVGGDTRNWRRTPTGDGRYLERDTKKGEYELILFVPDHRDDGEHQLWFRALVDMDDVELAQKMVNAAYTQVTAQ